MSTPRPLIGIDLGTTHSLCAIFENGEPRLIKNAHDSVLTPSIVAVLPDGQILVGEAARQRRITQPEETTAQFKRWMGEDREIVLAGKKFSPAELSSCVLQSLRSDAEAYLGSPVEEAVITVPAYFNEHQRRATQAAGEMAGLKVRRILNEPTAAALSYGFHRSQGIENLLVFDLGGGTFDVTVMEIFEGTLEIRATAGESHLGGEDFTDRLVQWALQKDGQQLEHAEMSMPRLVSRLRDEAEKAKRNLSTQSTAQLRMPNKDGDVGPDAAILEIHVEEFREINRTSIERLRRPTERAMRDADLGWKEIQNVILVGGATRMPLVRQLIAEWSGTEPKDHVDPDQVVALGAAIQAALIDDDKAVEDLVMTDVCPFTLGVEITKEFGTRQVDGYFMPVIHRNTTIPVSRQEEVATMTPNQSKILLRIYQGESRKVEENLKLGELEVTGIPPGDRGQEVQVRFTYDLNGLLEVEAIVPATGARFETLLKHNVKGFTDMEIERARKKMQAVKFYPRDELENRRLLHYVESLVGELDVHRRSRLEEAIDRFEFAMDSGDASVFEAERQNLMICISALGLDAPDWTDDRSDGTR